MRMPKIIAQPLGSKARQRGPQGGADGKLTKQRELYRHVGKKKASSLGDCWPEIVWN